MGRGWRSRAAAWWVPRRQVAGRRRCRQVLAAVGAAATRRPRCTHCYVPWVPASWRCTSLMAPAAWRRWPASRFHMRARARCWRCVASATPSWRSMQRRQPRLRTCARWRRSGSRGWMCTLPCCGTCGGRQSWPPWRRRCPRRTPPRPSPPPSLPTPAPCATTTPPLSSTSRLLSPARLPTCTRTRWQGTSTWRWATRTALPSASGRRCGTTRATTVRCTASAPCGTAWSAWTWQRRTTSAQPLSAPSPPCCSVTLAWCVDRGI